MIDLNLRKFYPLGVLLKSVLVLLICFSICFSFLGGIYSESMAVLSMSGIPESKTIIIDAGHGGEDSGAVGVNGVLEKDLNLSISFILGELFANQGYTVIFTRTEDKLLYTPEQNIKGMRKVYDLKNRCIVANENPDAILVSIHMNSFPDEKYSGLQVYYSKSDGSYALADSIQRSVANDIQPTNNRKIKNGDDLYILKNTSNIGVLIECGFLTNIEECKKLSEKEYQKQLSFSIFCGIINNNENKS